MLNINNFTLLKNTNFKPQVKNTAFASYPKFNTTNLAPLAHDTVSFGSKESLETIDNFETCTQINNDAQDVQNAMKENIQTYFNELIYDPNNNPKGVINPVDTRIKTPESIREKVISKIQRTFRQKDKNGEYTLKGIFSPYDEKEIKNNLRDISGTQITMRDASDKTAQKIIDSLCRMIEDNHLVVVEIQNHTAGEGDSASYFSEEQLEKLRETVNEQRRKNKKPELGKIKPEPKESGYTALHLTFDTTSIGKYEQNRDYYHEMQIIGADVEILKDVENFCYKLKNGLDIMQGHYAYAPFVKHFISYYPDEKDKSEDAQKLRNAYLEYTRKAYELQRNRTPDYANAQDDVTNWAYRYPTIKECGFEGVIPVELDFNNLARIKRDCDDIYKVANNAQDILDGREQELDNKGKITYKDELGELHQFFYPKAEKK